MEDTEKITAGDVDLSLLKAQDIDFSQLTDSAVKKLHGLVKSLEREQERWRCKTNLFYLATEVLGYNDKNYEIGIDKYFHEPLCRDIEKINVYIWQKAGYKAIPAAPLFDIKGLGLPEQPLKPLLEELDNSEYNHRKRLFLWSRGYYKTSLITICHKIQLILIWPDIRILLSSNTLGIAQKMYSELKDHFVTNQKFRELFPEYCPAANKDGKVEFGTTENFTVPNRKLSRKEPTVDTTGTGTVKTGLHYDYMAKDDLINEDWINNPEQITKSKEWDGHSRQLYDNPTLPLEDKIGTRYHFNDLYNESLNDPTVFKSLIPVKGVLEFDEENKQWVNKDGRINFFRRFTEEGLLSIQNDPNVGAYIYNSQYLLNPIDASKQTFKLDWWQTYDILPNEIFPVYIECDPASTQKKKSDFTVILVVAIDSLGRWFVIDGIYDKLKEPRRIDKIFYFAEKYNKKDSNYRLQKVIYEVLGGRHGDLDNIEAGRNIRKIYFDITETKATKGTKIDRIKQRLVGRYSSGIILWPRNLFFRSEYDGNTYDLVQLAKNEFLSFPFAKHDDIHDCLSFIADGSDLSKGKTIDLKEEEQGLRLSDYYLKEKKDIEFKKKHPFMIARGLLAALRR